MSAFALPQCPLTNPSYKDLRSAAAQLQARVVLPAGCEDLTGQLQAMTGNVKVAIDQMANSGILAAGGKPDVILAAEQDRERLKLAVDSVQSISTVFSKQLVNPNSPCSKALAGNIGFLEAFVDTVNGLSPYLLVFEGISQFPLVLGSSLVSAVAKSFFSFYRLNRINMNDSKQRQIFIENACAFYTFNANFEALQNREAQLADSSANIKKLESLISNLESHGAPAISADQVWLKDIEIAYRLDSQHLRELLGLLQNLKGSDEVACTLVKNVINTTPIENSIARLEKLYDSDDKIGIDTMSGRQFLILFKFDNQTSRLDQTNVKECGPRAKSWLDEYTQLLIYTDQEMGRTGRREGALSEFLTWEAELNKQKLTLRFEKERQKWLKELDGAGESIDNSEITQIRDDVKDVLFLSRNHRVLFGLFSATEKSPSEAWLQQKLESAQKKLAEFKKMDDRFKATWAIQYPQPKIESFPSEIDFKEACAEANGALLAWTAADEHVSASETFCDAFHSTIEGSDYTNIQKYCTNGYIFKVRNRITPGKADIQFLKNWIKTANCPINHLDH